MSARDDLRQAVANIRRAAQLRKEEIRQFVQELDDYKKLAEKQIAEIGVLVGLKEAEMRNANETNEQQSLQLHVQSLRTQVQMKTKEISDERSRVEQIKNDVANGVAELERMASQLEKHVQNLPSA